MEFDRFGAEKKVGLITRPPLNLASFRFAEFSEILLPLARWREEKAKLNTVSCQGERRKFASLKMNTALRGGEKKVSIKH